MDTAARRASSLCWDCYLRQFLECLNGVLGVASNRELVVKHVSDDALSVHHERHALGKLTERPFHAIAFGNAEAGISDHWEGYAQGFREITLGLMVVVGDADHFAPQLTNFVVGFAELRRLFGSASGEGLGKEEKDHRLPAVIGQADASAYGGLCLKVGCRLA